jgi:hypothetical protein
VVAGRGVDNQPVRPHLALGKEGGAGAFILHGLVGCTDTTTGFAGMLLLKSNDIDDVIGEIFEETTTETKDHSIGATISSTIEPSGAEAGCGVGGEGLTVGTSDARRGLEANGVDIGGIIKL